MAGTARAWWAPHPLAAVWSTRGGSVRLAVEVVLEVDLSWWWLIVNGEFRFKSESSC